MLLALRGPLLLRAYIGLDRESLSWVCKKLTFNGSSTIVILVEREWWEVLYNQDWEIE